MTRDKILVVEDDPDASLGMALQLEAEGCEVLLARDCATGLFLARGELPGLILLDLGLPDGTGYRVIQELAADETTATIPIVVVSGADPHTGRAAALRAGAVEYLHKPLARGALVEAVRHHAVGCPGAPPTPAPPVPEMAPPPTVAAPAQRVRRRVLVVEDDPDSRLALELQIRAMGLEAIGAADVLTALLLAVSEHPELILLDLGLPGGGGREMLARLEQSVEAAAIPVLIVSAEAPANAAEFAGGNRVRGYLHKPYENAELAALVKRCLGAETESEQRPVVRRTILVIEDDADARLATVLQLRAGGYRALEAADGESGIELAQREVPDVLVLDLGLPGSDGFAVMGRLRRISSLARTPVIVLTALDTPVDRARALEYGAREFLIKPVERQRLLAAIASALGEDSR